MFLISSDTSFNSEEKGIPDESDHFMMDPVSFVSTLMTNGSLPSHVVLFDSEEQLLRDFLISHSFTEVHAESMSIYSFSFRVTISSLWLSLKYNGRYEGFSMPTSRWTVIFKHQWLYMLWLTSDNCSFFFVQSLYPIHRYLIILSLFFPKINLLSKYFFVTFDLWN